MALIEEVPLAALSLDRYCEVLSLDEVGKAKAVLEAAQTQLAGRTVWNVNSTPRGGGVAEMLRSHLGYARGAGLDVRWLVIGGTEPFFRLTKRIHHALHGSAGDGTALDERARALYEETQQLNAEEIVPLVKPGDIVILHDPQTAGLGGALRRAGATVAWRCHVGSDTANEETAAAWRLLEPYVAEAELLLFSREAFVPPFVDRERIAIMPPAIDPFSAKNQDIPDENVRAILVHTGLVEGPAGDGSEVFQREDGSPDRVDRHADIIRLGRAPSWETPLVVQVSRWDPLKDPIGVIDGFRTYLDATDPSQADLVLAGPTVHAVTDDHEQAATFDTVLEAWRELPHGIRNHVHIAALPMTDVEENAAIVNALQRHAAVVVQKSLEEGFGLTVTEAMWKGRPVVASRVGGIQDQIESGVNGVLLDDPRDPSEFARSLSRILEHPEAAAEMGRNARERVREHSLGLRHLLRYVALLHRIDTAGEERTG